MEDFADPARNGARKRGILSQVHDVATAECERFWMFLDLSKLAARPELVPI
jgi:hypothetical protein